MSLELKPESIIVLCLAAGGAVWKIVLMILGFHKRLTATEVLARQTANDLLMIKQDVEKQYMAVRADIKESRVDMHQQQVKLEEKVDRLIQWEMDRGI